MHLGGGVGFPFVSGKGGYANPDFAFPLGRSDGAEQGGGAGLSFKNGSERQRVGQGETQPGQGVGVSFYGGLQRNKLLAAGAGEALFLVSPFPDAGHALAGQQEAEVEHPAAQYAVEVGHAVELCGCKEVVVEPVESAQPVVLIAERSADEMDVFGGVEEQ